MAVLPEPISHLFGVLSKLPGVGPRSAERLALYLVQTDPGAVRVLADAMLEARK